MTTAPGVYRDHVVIEIHTAPHPDAGDKDVAILPPHWRYADPAVHPHTTRCWWHPAEARWVCAPDE